MIKRLTKIVIALSFLLMQPLLSASEIAIIVNKENATDNVSFTELVKIFKQDKQYWDKEKIYLILQEADSPEKKIILKKVYHLTDEELKKLWLAKMFKGEIMEFPKTLASNEAVKRFVSQIPNAVGFINNDVADNTVKVLKIDSKLPKDADYILTDR